MVYRSGTLNSTGFIEIETTALAKDSAASRLVALVEDAQTQRSPVEQRVEYFAKIYTPIMVLLAALMASLPWIWMDKDDAEEWVYRALVSLVIACPCALVNSTPITYVCALACAAKRGILVKGGIHLESLSRLASLALDKTGTLTQGVFELVQLESMPGITDEQLLRQIGTVERQTAHPMGVALVAAMVARGHGSHENIDSFDTLAGEGLYAVVNGQETLIGNKRLITRVMQENPESKWESRV